MTEELNYLSEDIENLENRITDCLDQGWSKGEVSGIVRRKQILENILSVLTMLQMNQN